MFKALMGGGRSSSDARSTVSSSSKSSRRRADSTKSSHSRKSSRGDDRDRGLDDPPYSPSASGSRRGPSSVAGDSVASTYVTAEPESLPSPVLIERTPKRRDSDRESKSSRRRTRDRSESRDRADKRKSRRSTGDTMEEAEFIDDRDRRERSRAGETPYVPPISTSMPPSAPAAQFATDTGGPAFAQFPGQYGPVAHSSQSPPHESHHDPYDPHVQQQFPGQFPTNVAEPYFPPNNPAGAAADYYGDQGQSVSEQPGIRPQKPSVIPNSQAHLMAASPAANPPPEPSSLGQVGAAAGYFDDDFHVPEAPPSAKPPKPGKISSKPTKPSKPSSSSSSSVLPTAAGLAAAGAAAYGLSGSSGPSPYHSGGQAQGQIQGQGQGQYQNQSQSQNQSYSQSQSQSQTQVYSQTQTSTSAAQHSTSYSQQAAPSPSGPSHSHSHGIGAGVGMAAAGAAAGYMLGHEHHSSPEGHAQLPYQSYSQAGPSGPPSYSSGPNNAMLPPGPAGYPMQNPGFYPHGTGALAMRHRPQGPISKFADFWRDPEGVGRFEDYTETIGVCKYCFEPGTTSVDAPRKHHYHARRHSSDRYSSSSASRVDKLSRYHSSEDESRRRKRSGRSNKSTSWLPGVLAGGLFAGKEFKDSYSVRPSRAADDRASSYDAETVSVSDRRSYTSRGVVRRSGSSQEQFYSDSKYSRRNRSRSRSRSRSSSRSGRHSYLKEAALGAAVGGAALAVAKSHQRSRSRSPSRVQRRKESSSSSSFVDFSRPAPKSVGGFTSFFTSSSENRKKKKQRSKRRGFFSFNSSSTSSLDNDLAFGSGFSKKSKSKKSKKEGKKKEEDVDAALLGLSATATALAASSHGRSRSTGQILTARESRSRHSNYPSSTNEDSEWIDAESEDQSSSSVNSALAFGGSSADSSSDSSRGGWGFFGFNKKKKSKKEKKDRKSSATNAALAAGAGALGGAALASVARHRDSRVSSSSGSLQQVYPVPTSDPSRFEAVHMSPSVISDQTPLVRPGPIPLQQPQPVTPVSQAVYTTQGGLPGSIPAYSAPEVPAIFNNREVYGQQAQGSREPAWIAEELPSDRRHPRRSDSSPIFPVQESPVPGVKRRSTTRDAASVSFALTEEQTQQQDRRDRKSRESFSDRPVQLVDLEEEQAKQEKARREYERREYERREQERRDYERREFERQELERQELERQEFERQEQARKDREEQLRKEREEREEEERRRRDAAKEKDSSSWVETAAIGAIGAAAVGSMMSRHSDDATASEANTDRYKERREKRRKEREQSRVEMESSVVSKPDIVTAATAPIDDAPTVEHEEQTKPRSPRRSPRSSPVYESYADFYVPEELRHSPDTHDQSRDVTSEPAIIERVPASDRDSQGRHQPVFPPDDGVHRPFYGPEPYENRDLPWEVPGLMLTKPTPDHSVNGSVTGTSSATGPADVLPDVTEETEEQTREPEREPSPEPAATEPLDPIYEGWHDLSSKERKKREKQLTRKGLPIPGKDGFELPSEKQAEPEPEPEHEFEEPEWKPRSTTGSRVSWGHDRTHEYEVPSSSEHEPTDHDISPLDDPTKEFAMPESEEKSRDISDKPNFGEDIEFAAILAAGTQAAGFDSAVVTDDPKYHTRTSPPGSEDEGTFSSRSKWTDVKEQPHGFVEGEVETKSPETSREVQPFAEHVIENEPFYSEPEPVSKEVSSPTETRQSTSIAQKVMEELNGKTAQPSYPENDMFSMPGGFDTAEDTREISQYRDDSRSVFSAPPEREPITPTKSKKSRRSGDDLEFLREAAAPVAATAAAAVAAESFDRNEDDYTEKRKHRKHRSKRDSDTFSLPDDIDDTRSTVTVDDDEKSERRRRRHRSSRDSEALPADDDARSVATAPDDGKSERRKHRHRSSRDFDDNASITSSPARIDEREKRRGKDEKEKSGGILRSLFGSRVSTSEEKRSSSRTSSRSSSLDKRPSRDAVSEAGVDEERRRRKRHSRHSSSGDKLDYDSDKVSVKSEANLEEYRSKRQEKEERRRQRYGDIVESGRRRESDKV